MKCAGARSAGNLLAACDVAGAGNGITEASNRARRWKRRIQPRSLLRITAPAPDPTTSKDAGNVPSLVTAEVLSAGTISWSDQVDSVASLWNVDVNVAGSNIHADSVLARESQVLGSAGYGTSIIDNFSINGISIAITGAANQVVGIPGGQVIVNEQTISQSGAAVVNAIHVTVTGVADVVLASATAGIS